MIIEAYDRKKAREESLFPERLEVALKASGINQARLALRIGVNRQTVNSWICRKAFPRFLDVFLAAQVLEVSLDWLFGNDNAPKEPFVDYKEWIKLMDLVYEKKYNPKVILGIVKSLP